MSDLPKTYNSKEVEDKIYQKWEASGFFNPDNLEKAHDRFWNAGVFSMAMPPPNATGELHVGHAIMLTIEDLMIRYIRMTGKKTLWLPGTDHAAIATQNVVERQLWEKEKKTRHDIGREELLRRIEEFVSTTRGRIQQQMRKMGASCDWSREKYTLSPELSLAVRTVFKKMYDAGLIYRGERLVNWCSRCGTTLADDEVAYKEVAGKLYYIGYPIVKGKGYRLTIATTRPETMLADLAVAVNPKDPRYTKYIGQSVMLPLLNRELPILSDPVVDPKFGTGVLKVTPGHDLNDFEVGKRHNLETISLFTPEGKINEEEAYDHGFEDYANLTVEEARKKIVEDLEAGKFIEKTEDIKHNVGHCYRCDTMVEPIVSKQWFVNVNSEFRIQNLEFRNKLKLPEKTTLREMALAAVKSGAIKVVPERFNKIYLQWLENLRDWNISRQIWFGHRIPVWYCANCGQTIVEINPPAACPDCQGTNFTQDLDTLDTWFSSSLWTFSTLGWPEETPDLKTYHPTTILETGYDILFFWVARMVLMTGFALEDIPFKTVYLHGLVRDIEGKKMSKSKGNVQNPIEVIGEFGADALRLSLILGTTPGNDMKISETKIQSQRNFINKLWNISRFVLQTTPNLQPTTYKLQAISLADQWILAELDDLISQVSKNLETYQYGLAGELLADFTWNKFADWYLEIAKLKTQSSKHAEILPYVLQILLKLWHPFIPFVTEHIWSQFNKSLLMIEQYPSPLAPLPDSHTLFPSPGVGRVPKAGEVEPRYPSSGLRPPSPARGEGKNGIATGKREGERSRFPQLQELIAGLRNLRAEYRQPPGETFACYLELPAHLSWVEEQSSTIENLARVKLNFTAIDKEKKMPYFLWPASPSQGRADTKVYLIIPHFDPKKERALAEKKLEITATLLEKLETQLNKKDFLKKAPAEVVEKIKAEFESARLLQEKLKEKISHLR